MFLEHQELSFSQQSQPIVLEERQRSFRRQFQLIVLFPYLPVMTVSNPKDGCAL